MEEALCSGFIVSAKSLRTEGFLGIFIRYTLTLTLHRYNATSGVSRISGGSAFREGLGGPEN